MRSVSRRPASALQRLTPQLEGSLAPSRRTALGEIAREAKTWPGATTVLLPGGAGAEGVAAAESLAFELGRQAYRIDLAAVIGKYVEETERALNVAFAAAGAAAAVLFLDEADALFGSRTDVRDSHDRYVNLDINSILERIEAYEGLVVLATNSRTTIDPAVKRRIRHVIAVNDDPPLP